MTKPIVKTMKTNQTVSLRKGGALTLLLSTAFVGMSPSVFAETSTLAIAAVSPSALAETTTTESFTAPLPEFSTEVDSFRLSEQTYQLSEVSQSLAGDFAMVPPNAEPADIPSEDRADKQLPMSRLQQIKASQLYAQTKQSLDEIKQELKVEPLLGGVAQTYSPSLTFAGASAFGPGWGDVFIAASGATAGSARDGQIDGSLSTGFGIGDARELISLGFTLNVNSIRNFGANGTFDLQGSRIVYEDPLNQVAVGAGWQSFGGWGDELPSSGVWGAVTSYSLLQPDNPINKLPVSLSLGVGGGFFREGDTSTGVFGNVGVQLAPQLGVGMGWSGVGFNLGMSFVPEPTIPLTITASGLDLTDNSEGGTRFLLSVSYGFNFVPRGF